MTNSVPAGHSQTEIERKYDVDEGAKVPDLRSVDGIDSVDIREPVDLEAVYYDTEGLDLADAPHCRAATHGGRRRGLAHQEAGSGGQDRDALASRR